MKPMNMVVESASKDEKEDTMSGGAQRGDSVSCINYNIIRPIRLSIFVNGKKVNFEVDTGADASTMTLSETHFHFPHLKIKNCNDVFNNFDGSPAIPLGVIENITLSYGTVTAYKQKLFIVKDGLPKVIGKNWLYSLQLWPPKFEQREANLKIDNKDLVHLSISPNCKPISMPVQIIPFDLKDKVKDEIKRLIETKRIVPVEHSEWSTPVIPIKKEDGSLRLCGDFRVTVNKYLTKEFIAMPSIHNIIMKLKGNSYFCKIHLGDGYLDIPLDDEAQNLLTIITTEGKFKPLYLPFGVTNGPMLFQKYVLKKLSGLDVIIHCYNIYVYGKTLLETSEKLSSVLKRLQHSGLDIKYKESTFFKENLYVFGVEINKQGIMQMKSNVKPLLLLPRPKNLLFLKSFMRIVNYYNDFLQREGISINTLNQCITKNKFVWTSECDKHFNICKKTLSLTASVSLLNKDSVIILTCNSCQNSVTAFLSVIDHELILKPVAFVVKKLKSIEVATSKLEKDAFAIMFGVTRFCDYLYGQNFLLETDNEQLAKLLTEQCGFVTGMSYELYFCLIYLIGFNYTVIYNEINLNPGDYFSLVISDE